MRIESGAPAGSRNYWAIVIVVCIAIAAYFLYDGVVGYRAKNVEEARRQLGIPLEQEFAPPDPEIPNESIVEELRKRPPSGPDELRQALGERYSSQPEPDGAQIDKYVSYYGVATVTLRNDKVRDLAWTSWGKTKAQIEGQYTWAIFPALFGLVALYKLIKTMRLRAVLDDEGFSVGGLKIGFDAMTSLTGYSPKGWVDLNYTSGGATRKCRLDNQRIERFDEIVTAICEQKGFDNPLKSGDEQADDAGSDDAAADEPTGEAE